MGVDSGFVLLLSCMFWFLLRIVIWIWNKNFSFVKETKLCFLFFSFAFIYAYTIAPFPFILEGPIYEFRRQYNLIPFSSIIGSLNHFYIMVPIRNIGGNILLFIPLGFSIANMFPHFSWKKVIILGAITSLLVELIQLNMPLRSLDIDDLLLNTIGTAVGYLSFKLVKKFLVNRGKKYYEM